MLTNGLVKVNVLQKDNIYPKSATFSVQAAHKNERYDSLLLQVCIRQVSRFS